MRDQALYRRDQSQCRRDLSLCSRVQPEGERISNMLKGLSDAEGISPNAEGISKMPKRLPGAERIIQMHKGSALMQMGSEKWRRGQLSNLRSHLVSEEITPIRKLSLWSRVIPQ